MHESEDKKRNINKYIVLNTGLDQAMKYQKSFTLQKSIILKYEKIWIF